MGDSSTLARQRDALVYGEANDFGANGVHELPARGRCVDRQGGCAPVHAEKGAQPLATEGEPPRRWPGFRHQGADLNGWLRLMSAPLRYYTLHDAG